MSKPQDFLLNQKEKLKKALVHLDYSYKKISVMPEHLNQLDEESLETWESFAARFARVADIFLMRYLRTYVLAEDPGFVGSMRDFVNQAEKLGLIKSADNWMAIRELRNISAHEYTDKDLEMFFKRLKQECPLLLSLKDLLNSV